MNCDIKRLVSIGILAMTFSGAAVAQRVDTVTGGGQITTASNSRANFGVNARDLSTPNGHLTYLDHGTRMRVRSTSITAYTVIDATTREIQGTCVIDGVSGFTFTATLVDMGEPGTSDSFSLSLSSGYSASGTLNGGNIRVHVPDPVARLGRLAEILLRTFQINFKSDAGRPTADKR